MCGISVSIKYVFFGNGSIVCESDVGKHMERGTNCGLVKETYSYYSQTVSMAVVDEYTAGNNTSNSRPMAVDREFSYIVLGIGVFAGL